MLRMRATLSFRPPGSDRIVEIPRSNKKDTFYDGALLHRRFAVGELRFVFDTFHHEFLEGWSQRIHITMKSQALTLKTFHPPAREKQQQSTPAALDATSRRRKC